MSADRPLSIVDLVTAIGADKIGVQNPLAEGTFIACNKRKGYTELAFATYPELAEEMFRGTRSKTLLVLVIDTAEVERAKAARESATKPERAGDRDRVGDEDEGPTNVR